MKKYTREEAVEAIAKMEEHIKNDEMDKASVISGDLISGEIESTTYLELLRETKEVKKDYSWVKKILIAGAVVGVATTAWYFKDTDIMTNLTNGGE